MGSVSCERNGMYYVSFSLLQTLGFYFKDLVKKLILTSIISLPVTGVLIWIIKVGGEYFFIYTWLFVLAVSLVSGKILGINIYCLINKFFPL